MSEKPEILSMEIRPGVYVRFLGIPHDLRPSEGAKVARVIEALATGGDPAPPPSELSAAKAQLGQLAQALAAAKAEISALKADRAHQARKLEIDAFEAETNRLRSIQGDRS